MLLEYAYLKGQRGLSWGEFPEWSQVVSSVPVYSNNLRVTITSKTKPNQNKQKNLLAAALITPGWFSVTLWPSTITTAPQNLNIHHTDNRTCCLNVPLVLFYGSAFVLISELRENLDLSNHKICIQEICVCENLRCVLWRAWDPGIWSPPVRLTLFKDEHCPLLSRRRITTRELRRKVGNRTTQRRI